jgi:hypothetical protein
MLMGAAAFAVGALSSSAQTVYSQNVVGYVNTVMFGTNAPGNTLHHGQYTLVSNPLDNGSGNHVQDLFAAQGSNIYGDTVYYFSPSGQTFLADFNSYGWGTPTLPLPPGGGFFFFNAGPTFTNTFVGTVIQSPAITPIPLIPGYSLASSTFPESGYVQDLGLNANNGDTVYLFSQTGQTFIAAFNSYGWGAAPGFTVDPVKGPYVTNGSSIFYLNTQVPHATNFWSQSGTAFTVH